VPLRFCGKGNLALAVETTPLHPAPALPELPLAELEPDPLDVLEPDPLDPVEPEEPPELPVDELWAAEVFELPLLGPEPAVCAAQPWATQKRTINEDAGEKPFRTQPSQVLSLQGPEGRRAV
jgi:hypothetical protein